MKHKEKSLELTELLRAGSETGFRGFSLVYQPQVRAEDGGVTGAEALMRWQCEKYGAVPPSEFIPLLEQSGLIIPVGKWVFRQAVRQCRRWAESRPDFVMSINLSYLQAAEPDFISFMKNVLEEEGVRPKNIVVEFTESSVAQGSVRGIFRAIRSLGLKIAMDDFGTGYSSLGILKDAPADIVKIDKTFIRDIKTSSFDATFISFIVALCHDVGIQVCLEGVETEEEYQIVRSMDLDTIQGYFYGRPVSVQEFEMKHL